MFTISGPIKPILLNEISISEIFFVKSDYEQMLAFFRATKIQELYLAINLDDFREFLEIFKFSPLLVRTTNLTLKQIYDS